MYLVLFIAMDTKMLLYILVYKFMTDSKTIVNFIASSSTRHVLCFFKLALHSLIISICFRVFISVSCISFQKWCLCKSLIKVHFYVSNVFRYYKQES